MASIVQRNRSFCVVYNIYEGGKRKQKWETYHTRELALRRKAQIEMLNEIQLETIQLKKQHSGETIADFMAEYVDVYGRIHWSCSTYTSNCALIRNYIIPNFGAMRFSDFTPRTISAIYSELLKRQPFTKPAYANRIITPQTLGSIHRIMHSAFEQAVLWEYIEQNPFHKVALPKAYPGTPDMLLPEDIAHLMQECSSPELLLALHLAFAGTLRKGEILGLTWNDISFQSSSVAVNKTLKRVRRNALTALDYKDILHEFAGMYPDSRTAVVLKKPKTRSSIRVVYLPGHVMELLHDWKKHTQLNTAPDLIFHHSNGWPFQEESLNAMLEKELLRLGLPKVTFHSLRHSSITYKLMLTGGDIKSVQGDSGHAQADMITERYGHVIDAGRIACAQKFQDSFYSSL